MPAPPPIVQLEQLITVSSAFLTPQHPATRPPGLVVEDRSPRHLQSMFVTLHVSSCRRCIVNYKCVHVLLHVIFCKFSLVWGCLFLSILKLWAKCTCQMLMSACSITFISPRFRNLSGITWRLASLVSLTTDLWQLFVLLLRRPLCRQVV